MTSKRPSGRILKPRNEAAKALRVRAGNAGVAVSVDTRPKIMADPGIYTRKGKAKDAAKRQFDSDADLDSDSDSDSDSDRDLGSDFVAD